MNPISLAASRPIPLRPDRNAIAEATISTLVRTCIASARTNSTDRLPQLRLPTLLGG